jgi:alkylhydroperoxidase family enzyme
MTIERWWPGPYTLSNLSQELTLQLPQLVKGALGQLSRLVGSDRLPLDTRLAVQLRAAKLLGCPVCLEIFPRTALLAGMSEVSIRSAIEGRPDGLSASAFAAVSWIEAVIVAGGEAPEIAPSAATELTATQRKHLVYIARLERLVHSAGLLFLPHRLIERAAGI